VYVFLLRPLTSNAPGRILLAELMAVLFAVPACFVYMWVPVLIDRFEPEPWWMLLMTFLWGALAATGIAYLLNTAAGQAGQALAGRDGGEFLSSVVSAPLVEEGAKGLALLGLFWFMRREFDGLVDGVVYATFAALGFAMTENILYYTGGILSSREG